MSPRMSRRLRSISEALSTLAGGALLAGGVIALLWLAELATIR